MNACQAMVISNCSKHKLNKAAHIKKATKHILVEAYREVNTLPVSEHSYFVLNHLKCDKLLIEDVKLTDIGSLNIGVITAEFAGVKFKGDHDTGEDYLTSVQDNNIQAYLQASTTAHHMCIIEEKYSFTPDLFKALTRLDCITKEPADTAISIDHLRTEDEIVSNTKFLKPAITKTKEGKEAISTYLARNIDKINTSRSVVIDVDSEMFMTKCTSLACTPDHCVCDRYAQPLRCVFNGHKTNTKYQTKKR